MKKKHWLIIITTATIIGILLIVAVSNISSFKPERSSHNHEINITTDFQDKTINAKLVNYEYLIEKMDETNFWGSQAVSVYGANGAIQTSVTVRNLQIILTDKEQPLGKVSSQNTDGSLGTYQSFGTKFNSEGIMSIYLHVSPNIIQEESYDDASYRYAGILLSAVFDLTHPRLPEHTSFEERLVGKDIFMNNWSQEDNPKRIFQLSNK